MIKFITGNKGKLEEAQAILGDVEGLNIDLPEIQSIDAREIIEAKLLEAQKHHQGEFIVEDTSLYLDALSGLPGPLIKWFMKTIGNEGLFKVADKLGNMKARAITIIGYSKDNKISYYKGLINGVIVEPTGKDGFGWDPIFKPEGYNKTFAEMNNSEKNKVSMRKIALEKLKQELS